MKIKITVLFLLIFFQVAFGQRKKTSSVKGVETFCKCSQLVVRPYFYYKEPETPNTSYLYLRFDFQHKGMRCKPEFVGSITIERSEDIKVTIPLNTLTSFVDTADQRIFVITPLSLPDSFRPMVIGGNYKITYSMNYGDRSVCLNPNLKIIRFSRSEPIL